MKIFDGVTVASQKEQALTQQVAALSAQGVQLKVAAIVFAEDAGSQLYTRLKQEAAERVGISYQPFVFSITDPVAKVSETVQVLNDDKTVTGIIIQKPTKKVWAQQQSPTVEVSQYTDWWRSLTTQIAPHKDVDGLHPSTLAAIEAGTWQEQGRVLPATCQAVLDIMTRLPDELQSLQAKVLIIGKSDLLGTPLYGVLKEQGRAVELLTKKDLAARQADGRLLLDAKVIVSATGVLGLITGELISEGVALIDVGEPRPDIDRASVGDKPSFITPVPGGVGPMTVSCLLENALKLAS